VGRLPLRLTMLPVVVVVLLLLGRVLWLSEASHVHRRGLLELAGTVSCVGSRSPIAYVNYGCYCGLGGNGYPVDDIDRCCYKHDCCYIRAEKAGCYPKTESYSWQCVQQTVVCEPTADKCQELMCKCDQEFAYCLAPTTYNLKYLFYPHFLCGIDLPKCDQLH
uniref:Phospholipase A2 n=2 Tax=Equus TaxID=9789 RepID=A0A9L0RVL3_HORSE